MSEAPRATPLRASGREAGLSDRAAGLVRDAGHAIREGRLDDAGRALDGAAALAPAHAEVRRMRGIWLGRSGRHAEAVETLRRLADAAPGDAVVLNDLASALYAGRDVDAAFAAWQRACEIAPGFAAAWLNYGKNRKAEGDIEGAIPLLERALRIDPSAVSARVVMADAMIYAGRLDDAIAQYREALHRRPDFGSAWWGLANTKTVKLTADEIATLETLRHAPGVAEDERIAAGFALGKALEDHARYEDAFAVLNEANARMRASLPWDQRAFSTEIDAVLDPANRPRAEAVTADLGHEVIFIVSLPRSGSTLTEQILAAHPDIEGASELPALGRIIQEESERRRKPFPAWVAETTPDDWERLGGAYLARTARWRTRKPRFTDKMPNNWPFVGAALAMLPGARVIDCRRDPVETAWSCFKQRFGSGQKFSYDLADIAATWKDYDRAMRTWAEHAPDRVRMQVYERLLADPDAEIRALLAFCGVPFDAACLRFHEADRAVRTASAAQVREPLRKDTARSAGYGRLLDPLRALLDA
jgi:tetratricopeptide (TPR) repeat protein